MPLISNVMLKSSNKINLTAFSFIVIATVLYFKYFYKEDISLILTIGIPFILFLPILLSLIGKNIKLPQLNGFLILGFCVGFIFSAFLTNNNIWPIALALWLVLSMPGILTLNLICFFIRKSR